MKKVASFFGQIFDRKPRRKKSTKGNGKRPKSMFVGRQSGSPEPRLPPIATSLEDLMKQSEEASMEEKTSETPLKKFASQGVTEKSESGSIVYYRSRKHIDKANQSEPSRDPRDRIKSSGYPFSHNVAIPSDPVNLREFSQQQSSGKRDKAQKSEKSLAEYKRSSGDWDNVPKSTQDLPKSNRTSGEWDNVSEVTVGLPQYNRLSGEWDNVPKPPKDDSLPPVPARRYLDSPESTDMDRVVSQSDWSEDMPRPRISEPEVEQKINHRENSAPVRQREPSPILRKRPPSPKQQYREEEIRNTDRDYINRDWSPSRRPGSASTPGADSVFSHGSDNMAFVRDSTPSFPVPTRDYRNVPMHPDRRYRRPKETQLDRQAGEYYPVVEERRRQSRPNRRGLVNATIQENGVPLGNYDPDRSQLIPGVYLRVKPYYRGEQDARKRYSDASDYSDVLYNRRSNISDRAVHPRDVEPYFFRSRWSVAPDQIYDVSGRRNSDFNAEEYVREMQKQHYRRSLMQDLQYESDIVRGFPRPNIERNGRLSSGYQSQASKQHDSSSDIRRLTKSSTPPNLRAEHYPNTPLRFQWMKQCPRNEPDYGPPSHPPPPLPQYQSEPFDKYLQNTGSQSSPISASSSLTTQSSTGAKIYRQMSNEYGDLIDVLYRYKKAVRNSRELEMPKESPESRLKFEREKIRAKLTEELGPEHRQSENLDMIIEALLYLCETKNKSKNKRSRQKGQQEEHQSKARSNSATFSPLIENNEEKDYCLSADERNSDVTKRSSNENSKDLSNTKNKQFNSPITGLKYPVRKRTRRHDYCEIKPPLTAPVNSSRKEFAFPSEDELNRILGESNPEPPALPPRKYKSKDAASKASDSTDIGSSQNGSNKSREKTTDISSGQNESNESREKITDSSNTENAIPDYAEVDKQKRRRRSLPSMHFSESELQWLSNTGGEDETPKPIRKFEQNKPRNIKPKYKSTRQRTDSTRHAIPPGSKMAGFKISSEINIEEEQEEKINLEDFVVSEKTDAQDIVTEVERRMSKKERTPAKLNVRHSSPYNIKRSFASDSDMGTWSSVASGELPPSIPRRLNRSVGKYSSSDNSPIGSPVNMRFHTPPPANETPPPLPIRKESLSPIAVQRAMFQTPPATPHIPFSSPLARRASSVHNVSAMRQPSPSPGKQISSQNMIGRHVTSKKQIDFRRKSVSPALNKPSSEPTTPFIVSKIPPSRTPSKAIPKLPFMGKKFDKTNKVEAFKSPAKHISRTGEIITLPDDSEYATPWDCIETPKYSRRTSVNTDSFYPPLARSPHFSPNSPGLRFSENSRFFPIREDLNASNESDYDYAIPINSPPSSLLKRKKLSRSTENILRGYETAV